MGTYEKIQSAIQELLKMQKPYEELINSCVRIKELEVLITSATSYADGVSILMQNKKYDSVSPICRSFIELYPSITYMIEKFSDVNEFDKYFKKMVVDDMVQDLSMYKSLKSDTTIQNADEKNADLETYITRWENMVNKYFPDKVGEIDESDKETSLMQIIIDLKDFYKNAYQSLTGSKNNFIGDAIKNNKAVISATGKEYESSYTVYRLLCSETHGNIGSLDTRVVNDGVFAINTSSEHNAEASSDLIYWSLKDIEIKFKELLAKESLRVS